MSYSDPCAQKTYSDDGLLWMSSCEERRRPPSCGSPLAHQRSKSSGVRVLDRRTSNRLPTQQLFIPKISNFASDLKTNGSWGKVSSSDV